MVSPDGDVRAMWTRFVGEHFTKYLCTGDFFPLIHRDVSIGDNSKCIRTPDALVVWDIGYFAYA